MKIALRSDGPMRLWHARLADRLAEGGHTLLPRAVARRRELPSGLDILLAFERRVYGAAPSLFEPVAPASPGTEDEDLADVVIEPLFDGEAGESALMKVLLQGRAPRVSIRRFKDVGRADLAVGLPAIEEPGVLSRSLDQVLAGLIALIVQAVRNLETGAAPAPVSAALALGAQTPSPHRFLARGLAQKLARRLGPARGRPDHWRIAMRQTAGAGVAGDKTWPPDRFMTLPDDGLRFQADPFPFEHNGRTYLFFEDFPYRTRKGVIAMVEIDADGPISPPRTVLEQPVHLSYPFVFTHEGAIYMLPEMSAAGRIQLFRADPFPDRWVEDRVLVDGVVAGDATPILHDGRYWMFATLSGDGGSSWDRLGLFHAPALFGPWTAHPANPVLVDAGAARPAGAMWHEDGALMRVAQDCRAGYGVGLAICRVDRLDPQGYAQTIVRRIGPPDGFGADGVHTLNRSGSLEVIDLRSAHAWR